MRFVLCDELVICVVSLGTGTVPHPWSARKPKPSLLQVLVWMQKLLLDAPEIFFEFIGQCPTFLTHNLLECFPKSKDIEVCHAPPLPFIEHPKWIRSRGSIRRGCRTRLCTVLRNQQKHIPKFLDECSCLSRLFAF